MRNKKLLEWDDCFNYWGRPYIYSAHWVLSESDPLDLRGAGGSAGDGVAWALQWPLTGILPLHG